tara:strand:- start:122 stop:1123 length:1002 start_codon:yes stop_codon:yes gene_type:complete
MVRTGAHVYVKYGWEEAVYGVIGSGLLPDKKFGLQDKMSSLTLTNNKVNLAKLNQNTVDKFAYGQQQGSTSMSFTLSSPWIIGAVLGTPSIAGSANPYTHTYPHATNGLPKTARTIQIELGYDTGVANADIVRTLKGGVVGSLSISASVGGLVDCSTDITYGVETAPSQALTGTHTAPVKPSQEFPYTFAHASLVFNGASASDTVAQCQDVSINLAQNAELLYGLGNHSAATAYKRVLDITGSFKASWIDKTLLDKLLAQIATAPEETLGGAYEFILTFEKSTTEQIVITLSGLTINDLGISGLEPVEPVFEDISWTAKTITVVAKNSSAAEQ